jgi:hypothetical protein
MPIDINDGINEEFGGSTKHLVYKDGVKVKYPDKDGEVFFCVLPAIDDENDPASYIPYRFETGKFTPWATMAYYYPFVNKEKSILSPKTLDPNAMDPIEELIKTARSNPQWQAIAGFGPDGKKMQNAFKDPEVRIPSKTSIFVVNGIILYDREYNMDDVYVIQIPSTAFRGQASGEDKKNTWGLIGQLNTKNRGAAEDDDFETKYFWGDITDPKKLVPVKLAQEKPPTGSSFKIYNLTPQDEDPIKIGKGVLEKRYDLSDIFYDITSKEIIEYLVSAFGDQPDLLEAAFASKVPGFSKMLKASRSAVSFQKEESHEDDELDMLPVKTRARKVEIDEEEPEQEPKRSFAPPVAEEDEEQEEPTQRAAGKKKNTKSLRNIIEEDD